MQALGTMREAFLTRLVLDENPNVGDEAVWRLAHHNRTLKALGLCHTGIGDLAALEVARNRSLE